MNSFMMMTKAQLRKLRTRSARPRNAGCVHPCTRKVLLPDSIHSQHFYQGKAAISSRCVGGCARGFSQVYVTLFGTSRARITAASVLALPYHHDALLRYSIIKFTRCPNRIATDCSQTFAWHSRRFQKSRVPSKEWINNLI
jgi:hypothetical protein